MKHVIASLAMGCALAASASACAAADMSDMNDMSTTGGAHEHSGAKNSMSHGEVRKVDAAAGKLTIRHGPLENLGMGPMTMVFKVKDPAMLSQVNVGDSIDFVAEEPDGALTMT